MTLEIRGMREEERERARAVQMRAFNVTGDRGAAPPPPAEDLRVAELDGTIVGTLRLHRFAQFFGGRPVPSIGIGGVAVAPEARGRRIAERIVVETLREARGLGLAISPLYPATVPLYRRCGYEFAAMRVRYRTALRGLPRADGPVPETWDDTALDEIAACYATWARAESGLIDRSRPFWESRVLASVEQREIYRVAVREGGSVTGYAVFTQEPLPGSTWGFSIDCHDLVWLTPGAAGALLAYFGRHRSTATDLVWTGSPADSLALLLPEQDAAYDSWFRPMLRVVDVAAAIEARGYPAGLEAAFEIHVSDDAIPENAGGWRVEISGGTAKVSPEGGARARVDVGALAAIWAGMLPARTARRLGRLDADDHTADALDAAFAGPVPWILDWF